MNKNNNTQGQPNEFPFSAITTSLFVLIITLPIWQFVSQLYLFDETSYKNLASVSSFSTGLFVLPVIIMLATTWSFLRQPREELKLYKPKLLDDHEPDLAREFEELIKKNLGKTSVRLLLIQENGFLVRVIGSWSKRFIFIYEGAIRLFPLPQLKAVIAHELGHLKNGDIWKARIALEYVFWNWIVLLFFHLKIIVDWVYQIAVGELQQLNFMSVVLQQTVIALILTILVRYIVRIREFGADDYASKIVGVQTLTDALLIVTKKESKKERRMILAFQEESMGLFARWLRFHPSIIERIYFLKHPARAFEKESLILAFVFGLIIGSAGTFIWGVVNIISVIGLTVLIAPLMILMLTAPFLNNSNSLTKQLTIIINSIFSTVSGVAIPTFLFELPINIASSTRSSSIFTIPNTLSDINFILTAILDNLYIITLILPLVLFLVIILCIFVMKIVQSVTNTKHPPSYSFGWLLLLSINILFQFQLSTWWNGSLGLSYQSQTIGVAIVGLWIVVFFIFICLHHIKNNQNKDETSLNES